MALSVSCRVLSSLILCFLVFSMSTVAYAVPLLWSPTLLERSAEREKEFQVFNAWLASATGQAMGVALEPNYDRMIARFEQNELSMLWVGPKILKAILQRRPDARILAMTRDMQGNTDYRCVLFARNETQHPVEVLMMQPIALTQPMSTCGSVGASVIANQVGVRMDPKQTHFAGSHQNVIVSVMLGEVESGIVAEQVFDRFSWLPIQKRLRSHSLLSFVWLVNPALVSEAQQAMLKQAFSNLPPEEVTTQWYAAFRHGFETDPVVISQAIEQLMRIKD